MRIHRLLAGALITVALCACGVNPVTGKREIQFVSEAQELQIGQQQYAPTKQSEGGELTVLPELTTYVNEIGQKLAVVADRKLPYEFTVLNSSVPNAWALPGGKIAINRGLLTELKNEAELAAVLGHEIVHAAARHGAKAQERGTLLQAGLAVAQIGAAVSGVDTTVAALAIQGAGLGAQLISVKYGREAELESDKYGMKYMKLAGYDPWGAVTLQETFVRLSQDSGKQQNWLEGLFASHPPSQERVEQNKATTAELGRGGEVGVDRYAARVKPLLDLKPAYDKHDQALAAAAKKDYVQARKLAAEATKLVPREARFQQALGDIAMAEKKHDEAVRYYQKAVDLDPRYFAPYLGAGVAQYRLGNKQKAQEQLTRSSELLPTAPAAYYLGSIAQENGDRQTAMKYYQAAASSRSEIGQRAATEYVRLDLPQNPGNYIATSGQLDPRGRLLVVVENRAPVPLTDIQITPVLVDNSGNVMRQSSTVRIGNTLPSGQRVVVDTGVGQIDQESFQRIRFRIEGAQPTE